MTCTELEMTEQFQGVPSQSMRWAGDRQGGDRGTVLILNTFFQCDIFSAFVEVVQ